MTWCWAVEWKVADCADQGFNPDRREAGAQIFDFLSLDSAALAGERRTHPN